MLNHCSFINTNKKRCFETRSELIFVRSYGFLLIFVSELINFNNYCHQDPVTPTITHPTITITHSTITITHYHPLSLFNKHVTNTNHDITDNSRQLQSGAGRTGGGFAQLLRMRCDVRSLI